MLVLLEFKGMHCMENYISAATYVSQIVECNEYSKTLDIIAFVGLKRSHF